MYLFILNFLALNYCFQFSVFLMSQMIDAPTTDLWIGLHSFYKRELYWTDGRPRTYINLNIKVSGRHMFCAFNLEVSRLFCISNDLRIKIL